MIYKQKTCEGCLPVCLLTLIGSKVIQKAELNLLVGGYKRVRESYALGIALEFVSSYKKKLIILISNREYHKKLSKLNKSQRVQLTFKEINLKLINTTNPPYILYLDNYVLARDIHYPHFVIVERRQNKKFVLIDPWDGKRRWLTESKLLKGVLSLKNYLKFCPLVIKLI